MFVTLLCVPSGPQVGPQNSTRTSRREGNGGAGFPVKLRTHILSGAEAVHSRQVRQARRMTAASRWYCGGLEGGAHGRRSTSELAGPAGAYAAGFACS